MRNVLEVLYFTFHVLITTTSINEFNRNNHIYALARKRNKKRFFFSLPCGVSGVLCISTRCYAHRQTWGDCQRSRRLLIFYFSNEQTYFLEALHFRFLQRARLFTYKLDYYVLIYKIFFLFIKDDKKRKKNILTKK